MSVIAISAGRRRRRINLVVDGNSISAYHYTSIGTFDNHIAAVPSLSPRLIGHACFAVSGHTWLSMYNHTPESAWIDGATNILVAWEGVNSMWASVEATEGNIASYATRRRSLKPWRMLYMSAQPVGGTTAYLDENLRLIQIDTDVCASPEAFGFDAAVNLRTTFPSEFGHDGSTAQPFQDHAELWVESTPGSYLHPQDAAKNLIAPVVASAVLALA